MPGPLGKAKSFRVGLPLLGLVLACNLSNLIQDTAATQTGIAFSVQQYSTSAGGRFPSPTATGPGGPPAGSAAGASPTASETRLPSETPTATLAATVAHLATPPGATGTTRYATDPVTKDYAPQKKSPAGSDVFAQNRYERPFTSGTMEYLPDVDLTRVELRIAAPWVYVTFTVAGARAEGIGATMYGAEFDVNRDGRGEYLVWGASPAGTEWTAAGVEVWKDSNGDAGGNKPQLSESPGAGGDGYDRNIFSGGRGADPDMAWIRRLDDTKVQLGFHYSAIDNAPAFLWNGLADYGVRRPDWFDYNDHFTQGEAGSPFPTQADYYPLQALWGVDNTCRDANGFTPTGAEVGLCQYDGSIGGTVAWDIDHDGALSATELSIAKIAGDTVMLGQGACPASGYRTAVSDGDGRYAFAQLTVGTYCVRVNHTTPIPIATAPITVALGPGENKTVNLPVPW
jgi:hypothetical protein